MSAIETAAAAFVAVRGLGTVTTRARALVGDCAPAMTSP